jgi:hypothetical protein
MGADFHFLTRRDYTPASFSGKGFGRYYSGGNRINFLMRGARIFHACYVVSGAARNSIAARELLQNPQSQGPMNFKERSFWLDTVQMPGAEASRSLPESTDVAVIGAGYTRLSAARAAEKVGAALWIGGQRISGRPARSLQINHGCGTIP